MNFRVYIIVETPILDKKYELLVPIDRRIHELISLLRKNIPELSENYYKENELNLYNKSTGEITVKLMGNLQGEIIKNSLGNIELNLYVEGVMVLPCAITLKPVNYPFSIEISGEIDELMENFEEKERNFQNSIDILPIIWENILMEIPMRVVSEETEDSDIKREGNGWKFVTEEEENKSPLSELMDYLDDSEVK